MSRSLRIVAPSFVICASPRSFTMSLSIPRGPSVVASVSAMAKHAEIFERSCPLPWEVSVPSFRRITVGCYCIPSVRGILKRSEVSALYHSSKLSRHRCPNSLVSVTSVTSALSLRVHDVEPGDEPSIPRPNTTFDGEPVSADASTCSLSAVRVLISTHVSCRLAPSTSRTVCTD